LETEEERERRLDQLHKMQTELIKGKRPKPPVWKTALSEKEAKEVEKRERKRKAREADQ
jgi:hypothetical protein